eukprot:4114602-Prymnesium_polylepis.1
MSSPAAETAGMRAARTRASRQTWRRARRPAPHAVVAAADTRVTAHSHHGARAHRPFAPPHTRLSSRRTRAPRLARGPTRAPLAGRRRPARRARRLSHRLPRPHSARRPAPSAPSARR